MSQTDLYATLGVTPDVEDEPLKRAYRALAKRFHPDLNPSPEAEDRFKTIAFAYRVLSNPTSRDLYDRFGPASLAEDFDPSLATPIHRPTTTQPHPSKQRDNTAPPPPPSLSDLLGRPPNNAPHARGDDIFHEIHLPISRLSTGATLQCSYPQQQRCPTCHGSGARPGSSARVCGVCNGLGRAHLGQTGLACSACAGTGQRIELHCLDCAGQGLLTCHTSLKLRVPPNTPEGASLRAPGRGHQHRHGLPGDLIATLRLDNDTPFERHGHDLHLLLPITISEAALGASLQIPTLLGLAPLTIPPLSNSGHHLRLHGAGLPRLDAPPGDLLLTLQITLPPQLDDTSLQLLAHFATLNPLNPRPW